MANAEITLKVQVVLHAQAPTTFNLCRAQKLYWLLDGVQKPVQTPQSLRVEQITEARPVTANVLSYSTWSCITEHHHCCCPLSPGAVGRAPLSQVSYHPLNNALKAADSWHMNSTLELCSDITTCLGWSTSLYLRACIWVYSMQPNFLLQPHLSIFSLACVLTGLS